jgi:ribosomal-protein-alanine N-acetyltransferase
MGDFKELSVGSLRILEFRDELVTEQYVNWLNNQTIVRYSEQRHYTHSILTCRKYLQRMREADELFLSIEIMSDVPFHIGNISVAFDKPNSSADLSILIGEQRLWGKGYASMAWNATIDFLLSDVGMRRVTAGTMEVNYPMIRLMKKSGMRFDCYRPRHFMWEGQEIAYIGASRFMA